ncbi:MAG: hypothetical protein RJA46_582 [Pseudomonadota bacterium]
MALRYVPTTPTPDPSSIIRAPLRMRVCSSLSLVQSLYCGHANASIKSLDPVQTYTTMWNVIVYYWNQK